MSPTSRDKNPRTGVLFCNLTGFCGYLLAQGYPCLIAHGIVCPGLNRPAAESLLLPERSVSTAFGWMGVVWSAHVALYHGSPFLYTIKFEIEP